MGKNLKAPADHAMNRRDRPLLNHLRQRSTLTGVELRLLARGRPVDQLSRHLSVKPQNPIPNHLKADPADFGYPLRLPPSQISASANKRRVCFASTDTLAGSHSAPPSYSGRSGIGDSMAMLPSFAMMNHIFRSLGIPYVSQNQCRLGESCSNLTTRISPAIFIIKADNVILAEISTGLNLN